MTQEVKLNINADALKKEDYDSISIALKKLTTASEEQFEDIKKEKWFNRLFDMITFSKKNEKRVAEQIITLAQAQQILFEILLRFASQSLEISEIIKKHSEYIETLSVQDEILAIRIKELEDIRLGVKPKLEIESLTDKQKGILSALLYKLAEIYAPTSEEQQNFALNLEKYLGKDRMDNPEIAFLDMEEKSRTIILLYCMEYAFLNNCDNTSYEKIKEIIYASRVSPKDIDNLKEQISADYKRTGAKGFYYKYQPEDYEFSEFFELEFDDEEYVEENIPREDESITSILEIPSGETKIYKNKNIHISSIIHCSGKLVFDNCSIYYNESTADLNRIVMSSGAEIVIKNSDIICKGYNTDHLIKSDYECLLSIENCNFEDCCYFANFNGIFTLKECTVNNSFENLFDLRGEFLIEDNVFNQDKLSEMYIPHIDLFSFSFCGANLISLLSFTNKSNIFVGNKVIQSKNFGGKNPYAIVQNFLDAYYLKVENSSFKGLKRAIRADNFKHCIFEDCEEAIELSGNSKNHIIDHCEFKNCTNAIKEVSNTNITHCKFEECYNNLISTSYQGGIKIEFCKFENIKVIHSHQRYWNFAIDLKRSKASDSLSSSIENCTFGGIELINDYLIGSSTCEKPKGYVGYVHDCTFKNITTNYKSKRIIKEDLEYETAFKEIKSFEAISVYNCSGLDAVETVSSSKRSSDASTKTGSSDSKESAPEFFEDAMKIISDSFTLGGTSVAAAVIKHIKNKNK